MNYGWNIIVAAGFALCGATILELMVAGWNRLTLRKDDDIKSEGLVNDLRFLIRRPFMPFAGRGMLTAAQDYLAASGLLLARGIEYWEHETYDKTRAAWLELSMATKREIARKSVMSGDANEIDFGLRELAVLGEAEDLGRIERLIMRGYFQKGSRQLARNTIRALQARTQKKESSSDAA